MKTESAAIKGAQEQCKSELESDHQLDPIRDKVELFKPLNDGPPPFQFASNNTFPTDSERVLIAKWATMRDTCIQRGQALLVVPPAANMAQSAVFQEDTSFAEDATAHIRELIVSLYQQKLTYGEFAQKRYWISSQAVAAELAYRQSVIDHDEQRQLQAQQQFANTLTAWGNYIQAVNSRQPQTVYINGTIRVQ